MGVRSTAVNVVEGLKMRRCRDEEMVGEVNGDERRVCVMGRMIEVVDS